MPAAAAAWAGPACGARGLPRGFTLLEIMLVLTVMAVAVALVAPDFFLGRGPGLDDESRRLQLALQLAAQDAQVDGVPVRWTATAHGYRFEKWDPAGTWDVERKGPLQPHVLPAGIRIAAVNRGRLAPRMARMAPQDATDSGMADAGRTVGQLLFWPDGSLTMADIELAFDKSGTQGAQDSRLLRLRPGLVGIRLAGTGG